MSRVPIEITEQYSRTAATPSSFGRNSTNSLYQLPPPPRRRTGAFLVATVFVVVLAAIGLGYELLVMAPSTVRF